MAEDTGYFNIDSMEGYAPVDATLRDSHRLVDNIMDQVIADLNNARGIIVDARWNGGGYDSNALHIAGHFTDQQEDNGTGTQKVGAVPFAKRGLSFIQFQRSSSV